MPSLRRICAKRRRRTIDSLRAEAIGNTDTAAERPARKRLIPAQTRISPGIESRTSLVRNWSVARAAPRRLGAVRAAPPADRCAALSGRGAALPQSEISRRARLVGAEAPESTRRPTSLYLPPRGAAPASTRRVFFRSLGPSEPACVAVLLVEVRF